MWWRSLLVISLLAIGSLAQAANLSVQSMSPQGEVERLTQVVVSFNAPIHALGDMSQDAASSPLQVSLSPDYTTPPPAGSYRWLDERTLAYLFDQPQRQALKLYCKVSARGLSGHTMAKDVTWTISTPQIQVLEIQPGEQDALGNRADITLTFNQPIDMESLKQHTALAVDSKAMEFNVKEDELPGWVDPSQQLSRNYSFTSPATLLVDQEVSLTIKPGLKSQEGYTPLATEIKYNHISFRPLQVRNWHLNTSSHGKDIYDPEATLSLQFNNPVDSRNLPGKVILEVAGKDGKTFNPLDLSDAFIEDISTHISINCKLQPRATYRLTVKAGLTDSFGGVLAEDWVAEFKTGDYNPRFYTISGEALLEGGFPARQIVWLRNINKFTVTANYYDKDKAWAVYEWYRGNWWRNNATPPAATLTRTRRVDAPITRNQPFAYQLDLPELLEKENLDDGVALLTFEYFLPGEKGKQVVRTLVQHSNIGLSLKYGFENGLVWATNLNNGQPLPGVNITIWDSAGVKLYQGISGEDGILRLPGMNKLNAARDDNSSWGFPRIVVTAEHDGDFAVLTSFAMNALRYSADVYVDQSLNGDSILRVHAITQLPLYMPGNKVNYLVYMRELSGSELSAVKVDDVTVEIADPTGKVVHTEKGNLNAFGSMAGSFVLNDKARLGAYDVRLYLPGRTNAFVSYHAFNVQHYRMPDYRVQVELRDKTVNVGAAYFFGAPVGNAPVKLHASMAASHFVPSRLRGYMVGDWGIFYDYYDEDYGDEGEGNDSNLYKVTMDGQLDENGRTSFNLPPWPPAQNNPRELRLRAEVTDSAGQVVSGFLSHTIHPAKYYVGLRAPYLVQAGAALTVNLLGATADDKQVDSLNVEVSLLERTWDMVRERGPDGFYQMLNKYTDQLIESTNVTIGSGGGMATFTAPAPGGYIVQAKVVDDDGGVHISRSFVYVYGQGGMSPWQRFSDNRLELTAEEKNLNVGDIARIMVQNPFSEGTALITVEREGISRQWIEEFKSNAPVITVPMQETDAPNVFVSVLLIRGRNAAPPPSGPDLGKPQVRYGVIKFNVKDDTGLKVEVTPSGKEFRPGDEVGVDVIVQGDKTSAPFQVTLLAVDERVLAVAGNKTNYDPTQSFKRELSLKVLTEDSRVNIVDQRFHSGIKGEDAAGGGGDGMMNNLRSNFEPAVYWLAEGVTDDSGRLKASFNLPDSLTSYRIVAIAADKNKSFGVGESQVKASLKVQVLSSLPTFVVMGDKIQARFIVQNLSGQAGRALVKLSTEGATMLDESNQYIELAAGEMKSVNFACAVPSGMPGPAKFTVEARMHDDFDAASFSVPILIPGRGNAAASAGIIKPGAPASMLIALPANLIPELTTLDVSAAGTPVSSLSWPLRMLEDYPWMCLEQRVSKALGLAFTHSQAGMLGLKPRGDELMRIKEILQSIADFQDGNGQMHFWDGNWRDNFFYPYLTAYTLMASKYIEDMTGLALDSQVREQAYKFLSQVLKNQANRLSPPLEAMIIWLLAENGSGDNASLKASLNRLLSSLEGQDPFTLSCLLMAARAFDDNKLAADLAVRLEKGKVVTATQAHFSHISGDSRRMVMGSLIRDNALVLLALNKAAPSYPKMEALAFWLAEKVGANQWLNTQEASFTLLAMHAYLKALAPQDGAVLEISLAGKQIMRAIIEKAGDPPVSSSLSGEAVRSGELKLVAENGPVYWTGRLQYTLAAPDAAPVNSGFTVKRVISAAGGEPVTEAKMGDVLECAVTISVPESRLHVLVFDPLPAGLEWLNATNVMDTPGEGFDYIWEWREQRSDGLLLYASQLSPGVYTYTYKLRASAPGEFMHRATQVEEMYQPETFGRGAAGRFTVE